MTQDEKKSAVESVLNEIKHGRFETRKFPYTIEARNGKVLITFRMNGEAKIAESALKENGITIEKLERDTYVVKEVEEAKEK